MQPVFGQIDPAAMPGTGGTIELYLTAEYAAGLSPPAQPPTISASAVAGKRIDCIERPAAMLPAGTAATLAASTARSGRCSTSAAPLRGGLYSLQASYLQGAAWPTWACYNVAEGGATANAAAMVPMYSDAAVNLQAGQAYACVATYNPLTQAQQAAVEAISWPAAVSAAADAASSIATASAGACAAPAYRQPPRGRPPMPLDVQGSRIVNAATREPVRLHGINWFGFNVAMGMVDGLWAGGSDANTDFSTIAYQLSMLGYNAVRLPFAHSFLAKTDVWDLQRDCPDLSAAAMKQRLTDPSDVAANKDKILPENVSPMPTGGQCNSYLPSRNNMDRLLFVVQQFVALGMYVVLDYQPQGLEQQAYNLDAFVNGWADVWRKVTCLPNFNSDLAGRVLIDVMNEPDSMGIRWEASGDRPGAEQLYLATADALWRMTPGKMLFMFEGVCGQQ
jgi:Cellulase (glycosyl hydrolase family 5)